MIFFDEDCNARFHAVEAGTMTADKLLPIADRLAGTAVGVICIGVNGQNPMYPDSKVMKSFTAGFDIAQGLNQPWMYGSGNVNAYRNAANIVVLRNHGIDSNAFLIEHTRKRGMSPWVSIRMNDQHNTWEERLPGHSELWMNHPELRTHSHAPESGLSYEHEIVRDTFTRLVEEAIDRYDADAYVVDWMRHVPVFDDGTGEKYAHLITDMMARIRKTADRYEASRHHRIEIVTRVPATIAAARYHGLDASVWARAGSVSRIIIAPKYLRSWELNAREWKEAIGDPDFPVIANIDLSYQPYPGYPDVPEQGICLYEPFDRRQLPFIRGACRKALLNGADGIYFFNFMNIRNKGTMQEVFRECGEFGTLRGKNFAIDITYDDLDMDEGDFLRGWRAPTNDGYFRIWRDKLKKAGRYPYQLPLDIGPRQAGELIFKTGAIPEGKCDVLIRLEGGKELSVKLNGTDCRFQEGFGFWADAQTLSAPEAKVTVTNLADETVHILRASLYCVWDHDELFVGDNTQRKAVGCAVDI